MSQVQEDQAHTNRTIDLKATVLQQDQAVLLEMKERHPLLLTLTRIQDRRVADHMNLRAQEVTMAEVTADRVMIREVRQEVLHHQVAVARHRQVRRHQVLHLVADLREARDNNI
jgi:hypothetical protein